MKEKTTVSICAKCIRELLKTKFTNINFQIKSSNTIEGSAVNLIWTDGPTYNEVEQIIAKYRLGEFDRNKNIYINSNFNKHIDQVNYINSKRIMSDFAYDKLKNKSLQTNEIYDLFLITSFYYKQIKEIKVKIDKSKIIDIDDFFDKLNSKNQKT